MLGFYLGFTPFYGVQTWIAILIRALLGWSRIAAVVGVHIHDLYFFLWPTIYALEYRVGRFLMGTYSTPPVDLHHVHWRTAINLGLPILVGSIPIRIPAAVLFYFIVLRAAQAYARKHHIE